MSRSSLSRSSSRSFRLRLHPNTSLRESDCRLRQAFRPRPLRRGTPARPARNILLRPSRGHVAVSISLTPGSGPSPSGTSDWPRVARASSSRREQGPVQPRSFGPARPCSIGPSTGTRATSPWAGALPVRRPRRIRTSKRPRAPAGRRATCVQTCFALLAASLGVVPVQPVPIVARASCPCRRFDAPEGHFACCRASLPWRSTPGESSIGAGHPRSSL